MAPPASKAVAMRPRTKIGIVAVATYIALTLAKRSFKNAKSFWMVKRLLGMILGRIMPIPIPRAVSGAGKTSEMGAVIKSLGCKNPLIVTDEMLVKHGLVKKCQDSLTAAGFQSVLFDSVVANPPSELVELGYEAYTNGGCDSIIAFGGGSPMDTAKIIGAKVCNPKPVQSYAGVFNVNMLGLRPLPPFVAVPTTAGTGSETTIAAVITIKSESRKVLIADLGLVPKVAVFDPELLAGLPKGVTAATGMDALTHAIESYIGGWTSAFTRKNSLSAVEKIFKNMLPSFHNGGDLAAREAMLNASYEAGLAFTRANVGYVHAIAHQFGGMFHTAHGEANAMLLPHVLEYFLHDEGEGSSETYVTDRYCQLAKVGGIVDNYNESDAAQKRSIARKLIERISAMNSEMNIPSEVKGMKASDVEAVAVRALAEAHGEQHGFSSPIAFLFDLGYPVPKYMTFEECKAIISKVLPASER